MGAAGARGAKNRMMMFPIAKPMIPPQMQEMGHCCHGLSQSRGMGMAPIQDPITDVMAGIPRYHFAMEDIPLSEEKENRK